MNEIFQKDKSEINSCVLSEINSCVLSAAAGLIVMKCCVHYRMLTSIYCAVFAINTTKRVSKLGSN